MCGNLPVQFYNTSVGTLGAIWDFGDASNIDSINSAPSHLYSAPGVYNVTLIGISTGNACRDTFSFPINVLIIQQLYMPLILKMAANHCR
ncbi:MAG: PKD domain-containing protein [Bacteroidetes bacterium]|nr:PKD domain-containing protein [Bacteroidota bacterium]